MKIECGKYTIYGDGFCLWIMETYDAKKKGEKTGKTAEKRVAGYAENFEELLEDFVDRKTRSSDAEDLKTLLKDIASLTRDAKKIAKTITATRKELADAGEKRVHKGKSA